MLRFDVLLTLTKEEILDGLHRAQVRRAGKGRLIAQTVALVLLAAWSLIAYFGGGREEGMSLFIGIIAVVLIPVMWFVPEWQMQSIAPSMAENGTMPHLWVFEEGIDFGEERPERAYYSYDSFYCDRPTPDSTMQTLVMRFANEDIVVVPKALLTEEQWTFLMEKTVDSRAGRRRR